MLRKLNKKVEDKLNEYLEFDINQIFNNTDGCEVFGGALRDILANEEINDIDFITLPNSRYKIGEILNENGYKQLQEFSSINISHMYKEIKIIFEPITYVNKNFKKVQLIRPNFKFIGNFDVEEFVNNYINLVKEVDLSCCGISYDGTLREFYPDAIGHSLLKYFKVNKKAKMIDERRIQDRRAKLLAKNFKEITSVNEIRAENEIKIIREKINREKKITKIKNNKNNYEISNN